MLVFTLVFFEIVLFSMLFALPLRTVQHRYTAGVRSCRSACLRTRSAARAGWRCCCFLRGRRPRVRDECTAPASTGLWIILRMNAHIYFFVPFWCLLQKNRRHADSCVLYVYCTTARSVPQVSRYIIRFLTLLQLSAHAGQAGLQAGRAVVEQHLDLSVADAEAVRIADGGGEQAQPLVHWQGRVNARLADVGERAGKCGLEHRVDLLWFGWITETLYILSIVILYIRLVEDNRISPYQTPAEPRLCCGSMPQVLY